MKKYLFFLLLPLFFTNHLYAQIVGTNVFLQGNFVEAGINSCGVYGTDEDPPIGYHPTSPFTGLSFVADPDEDGWAVGLPLYCGDYAIPGSPVEGWAVEFGGLNYFNTDQYCSPLSIPGGITSYLSTPGTVNAIWSGSVTGLSVTQQSTLNKTKLYIITKVTFTNTGATDITDLYYMRNVDPDPDESWSGLYTTLNTVVSTPPDSIDALVTGEGITYGCYLGLGSRNALAHVSYGNFATTDGSASDAWNGLAGYVDTVSSESQDEAIQISFKVPTIHPGASRSITFAYIFDASQAEEALAATAGGGAGGGCGPTASTSATAITTSSATLNWTAVPSALSYGVKWRPVGTATWSTAVVATPTANLSGLLTCTPYEYNIVTQCAIGSSAPAVGSFTSGCIPCSVTPSALFADGLTATSATLHWSTVPGAIKYKVTYSPVGGGSVSSVNSTTNSKFISGLTPGTTYQFKVKAICPAGVSSPFSPFTNFSTPLRTGSFDESTSVLIFPNPAQNTISIQASGFENGMVMVKISNIIGENVFEKQYEANDGDLNLTIDLSTFGSGIYLVSLQQNALLINKKLVINH